MTERMRYRGYDSEKSSGFRREPHPGKGFEDYNNGDVVPVPRYYGTVTWIFEGWEVDS